MKKQSTNTLRQTASNTLSKMNQPKKQKLNKDFIVPKYI